MKIEAETCGEGEIESVQLTIREGHTFEGNKAVLCCISNRTRTSLTFVVNVEIIKAFKAVVHLYESDL